MQRIARASTYTNGLFFKNIAETSQNIHTHTYMMKKKMIFDIGKSNLLPAVKFFIIFSQYFSVFSFSSFGRRVFLYTLYVFIQESSSREDKS